MSREIYVAELSNPEDFNLKEVKIKHVRGANWFYVEWEDNHTVANWFPAPSLARAKALVRENWGNGETRFKWVKIKQES